jgi:hypothetical protein
MLRKLLIRGKEAKVTSREMVDVGHGGVGGA